MKSVSKFRAVKKIVFAATAAILTCLAIAPSAGAAEAAAPAKAQAGYNCGHVPWEDTSDARSRYNHCGSNWIQIRVQNMWFNTKDMWVPPGVTDIEGVVDEWRTRNSWCITNC